VIGLALRSLAARRGRTLLSIVGVALGIGVLYASLATDAYGQTTVMVTHEARAAAIADRILFLADGQIVRELGKQADQAEVLAVMNSLSA